MLQKQKELRMFTVTSLQNQYLNDLIKNKNQASVFLKNGIRLKGTLVGHTEGAVFLHNGMTQMVLKNAISTICPEMFLKDFASHQTQ
jgi:RNA chaperone Hfq